eukprot:3635700-Prymnesium_polylepis.3
MAQPTVGRQRAVGARAAVVHVQHQIDRRPVAAHNPSERIAAKPVCAARSKHSGAHAGKRRPNVAARAWAPHLPSRCVAGCDGAQASTLIESSDGGRSSPLFSFAVSLVRGSGGAGVIHR